MSVMAAQDKLDDLLRQLRQTRDEVEAEIDRLLEGKREKFSYTLKRGRVVFDRNIRKLHQQERLGSLRFIARAPIGKILSSPVIYGMIIPLVLLDISITLYQHICFRIYKIPRVVRSDYIVIDRHRLPYLNTIQKINCLYCEYGNGMIAYAREIIARTEQYWCPIKHARRARGVHDREQRFFDYGDAHAWRNELQKVRCDWETPDASETRT